MSLRILFLCTGNRARSQMAEGLARAMLPADVEVASAGTKPNPMGVHPLVVETLGEWGIDATRQRPKPVDALTGQFDYVITLCDAAAEECPLLPARRGRFHWGLPDPGAAEGDTARERELFTAMRDELEARLSAWARGVGLFELHGLASRDQE